MNGPFTITRDGDLYEQRYWSAFAAEQFPSYEVFWAVEIIPLTNRVRPTGDVHFQSQRDLDAQGRTSEDVAVAQLHYTLLLHVGRVDDLMKAPVFDRYAFAESFVRLTGASDVADELLQRRRARGVYAAWDEQAGALARRDWRNAEGDPLRDIRRYRNRLVHGRVVPELQVTLTGGGLPPEGALTFPRVDRVDDYLDWRRALGPGRQRRALEDFGEARAIVHGAWERVVSYVEAAWKTHLV